MRGSCCGVVFSFLAYGLPPLPSGRSLQLVHPSAAPYRCWMHEFRRAVAGGWVALILLVPLAVRASEEAVADPPPVANDIARRMQDREYAAAVEAIDQALARPDEPRDYLLYLKGRALLLDRQFDAAVAVFEQLGQQMPDSPWNRHARFAAGLAAVGREDFQRAAIIYREEAESLLDAQRKHELAETLLSFGEAFFQPPKSTDSPDYSAALRYFEEALKVGLLPDVRATTQFRAARCRQELKEHARAATGFAEFASEHPDHPLVIEAACRAGQCLLDAGKPVEARRGWYDLLDAHPDSPSEWIAETMFQMSRTWGLPEPESDADLELGVEWIERFLARFPAHKRAAQARLDLAVSYLARNRDEDSVRELTLLLADPRYQADQAIPQARVLLGQAYRDQNKFAEAIQVWREYLVQHAADPQWSDVQQRVVDAEYLLALDKYRAKDYPAASQLLAEFLAKYPLDHRCAGISVLFGRMKYEQQQWNEAIADWQAVVSKHPKTNEASYAQYMIGLVTERELAQPDKAIEAYRQVTRGDHARNAQAAVQRLTENSLTVVTERVFRSDEIPAVRLTTRNIPAVKVRVYRIDAEAYFRKSHRLDGIEDLDIALIAPDASFEFPVPDYAEYREFENVIPLPQPEITAGALVVTVGSETLEATTLVLRSDLEVIVKASPSEVFVWAQNMRTGKPWPGARLLISDGKAIADGPVTADDGACRWNRSRAGAPLAAEAEKLADSDPFENPASQALDGGAVSVLALADGHVAANHLSLEGLSVTRAKTDRGYLVTDRPAYQCGQQVFVRGCIRGTPDDAEGNAANAAFSLEALDPRGRIVWQQPATLGAMQTFSADFPLPPMGIPGTYRVVLRAADLWQSGQAPSYETRFEVFEPRLDPVRLQIESPRRVVYRGEDVEGKFHAVFPDGTPVRNSQLVYRLADQPVQTVLTDDRGLAPFKLSTRDFAESQVLTVSAELTRWSVAAEANFWFAARGLDVQLRTTRGRYVAGEQFDARVSVRDPEGSPVGQAVKLSVFQLVSQRGQVSQQLHSEQEIETAAADGTARATLKLDKGGRYRLRAEVIDRRGKLCSAETMLTISDDHDRKRLLVLADRRHYRVGETAEVNLHWREKPALALVTFETSRVLDYRLVALNTGANKLTIPITAGLAPNFQLAVSVMTDAAQFHVASAGFRVRRDLQISLEVRQTPNAGQAPDIRDAEPARSKVEVTVTTRGPDGGPVAAEVSLALVGRSLLERFRATQPRIGEVLGELRQTWAVRTGSSVTFAYRPSTWLTGTKIPAQLPAPTNVGRHGPWRDAVGVVGQFGGSFFQPQQAQANSFRELVEWMEQGDRTADEDEDDESENADEGELWSDDIDAPSDESTVTKHRLDPAISNESGGWSSYKEPETGYWNPAVITGDEGRATVVIPLPNRMAAWKLLAQGITADGVAGDARADVFETKELYGQWRLPAAWTRGDSAEVIALVHNRLATEQAVEVKLTAQIGPRRMEERKTVQVAAAESAEIPFSVAWDADDADANTTEIVFRLELTAGTHRDVVRQAIPIRAFGMIRDVATSGVAEADYLVEIESPDDLPLHSPRLQIVVAPTIERALLDAVLADRTSVYGSPVETAAADLMAALALQKLVAEAPGADEPVAHELDARIRAELGVLASTQLGVSVHLESPNFDPFGAPNPPVAQQATSGGWAWAARGRNADLYVTAHALWALALANRSGYPVSRESLDSALRCTAEQWTALADNDYDGKAILLHARCVAGQREFEQANGLYRERATLSASALLHLALAFVEMERPATAAELLDLIAQRNLISAEPANEPDAGRCSPHDSPCELRALYALALLAVRPQDPATREVIDWLLAHRAGSRWMPDRATGPAMLALCRWFDQRRSAGGAYQLAVSINGQAVGKFELDASGSSQTIEVPANVLVAGKQQVKFELTGPGRYAFRVLLSGTLSADELSSTTKSWSVERWYSPGPLERDGLTVPRGVKGLVKRKVPPHRNELHQLAAGRMGEVELRIVRQSSANQPEYLVVRDPIPAGTRVVESSVRGVFEWFELAPGEIVFYVGNRSASFNLSYALQGSLPGSYRASPTVVQDAYRADRIAVAKPGELVVLPLGTESTDPYRPSVQELLALGQRAFQQRQWQDAGRLLTELLAYGELEDGIYRDAVLMLLDVSLELNDDAQTVRHFEVIRDKWPGTTIPFAKLLRIGGAYQRIGEHERSYLGYRALVESLFTAETGVPGFLASRDHFLRSVDVMGRLLREYPPEPYVAAARFGLAQQVTAKAPEADRVAELKAAGIGRTELLTRSGRLLEALLIDHPDDSAADQVAFALAGGLLELGHHEEAATACEQYAVRYPDSPLLDSFWYISGYGRFIAGQPDAAREILRQVATSRPIDRATGRPADSVNKWPAIYILGQIEHSLGRVAEAIQQYRRVEDRFPDARQSIASLLRKTVQLPELTIVRPGTPAKVPLEYRNLTSCEIKMYRIDLLKYATLRQSRGGIEQANLAGIQPLHEATVELGDQRDHRTRTHALSPGLEDEGAYLVVCRGDQQFASGLLLITPLEIEVQHDSSSGQVRVTVKQESTDQPVFDARVSVTGSAMRRIVAGATDRRGVFVASAIGGGPTVIVQAGEAAYAFWRDPAIVAGAAAGTVAGWHSAQPILPLGDRLTPQIVAAVEDGKTVGVVVSGPGASAAEQQIERILDAPTVLKFEDTPLEDVAAAIERLHRIPVRVDERALDDMGIGTDAPVTITAHDTSLRNALRLILKPLDLTFAVSHDSIMITTPEESESTLTTALYPVTDLVRFRDAQGQVWEDYESLIEVITTTVAPVSWDVVGGPSSIEGFKVRRAETLVVSQTQQVHREIAALLTKLRALAAEEGDDGQPPIRERLARPEGWQGMGGMGGGFGGGMGGGFGGAPQGGEALPSDLSPSSPSPSGLLEGLEATRDRLQQGQVEKLQRMYDAGMGGGSGGMGAGGFF